MDITGTLRRGVVVALLAGGLGAGAAEGAGPRVPTAPGMPGARGVPGIPGAPEAGRGGMGAAATAPVDALHLAPLTVHGSKLTLGDVIAELSGALGSPCGFSAGPGAGSNYTLDAQEKPFWEIVAELSQKQDVGMTVLPGGPHVGIQLQTGGDVIGRYAIDGPVIGVLNAVAYRRTMSVQAPTGPSKAGGSLELPLLVAVDPRVFVTRFMVLASKITSAKDGSEVARSGSFGGSMDGGRGNCLGFTLRFSLPGGMPEGLMDIELPVAMIAGTYTTTAVEDVEHAVNKPVQVGNNQITINNFRFNGGRIDMMLTPRTNLSPGQPMALSAMTYRLVDATGKVLVEEGLNRGIASSHVAAPGAQGPFKLLIRMGSEGGQYQAMLRFKNVPPP